jgi:glyoxylase-like metal-dependent hydrolase (beta-lactamase superfamily II)
MTRIHHLNCATMRPFNERLVHGAGSWLARARMVCHCLLIETDRGLVLVDSGLGLEDCAHPERIGKAFVRVVQPRLDPAETAARQIETLGFSRRDVRHVVLTHLDLDHAGGLADFPEATIHVYRAEHAAAMHPTGLEHERYRPAQWAHGPRWQLHDDDGERFEGLSAVRAIVEPEVLLVPLHGHSRGHAAVAVAVDDGWLMHCGDAYFSRHEMEPEPRCPPGLAFFQRIVAVDDELRRENQRRLRELVAAAPHVTAFSAHDDVELDRLAASP